MRRLPYASLTPFALFSVFVLSSIGALTGCPRHVVIDPDRMGRHNDREWTVTSAPGSQPSAQPSATVALPPPSPPK